MRLPVRLICLTAFVSACGDDSTGASEDGSSSDDGSTAPTTTVADSTVTTTVTTTAVDESSSSDDGDETTTTAADDSTTTTAGDDTTTTSTADGSTTGSSDTTDGSTTDTGLIEGDCYDPLTHPWAGDLCGSAAQPCSILLDEAVDPFSYARNGSPAVTHDDQCNPRVLFSVAENGFFGHLATRVGTDEWPNVSVPVELALGGLAWDTDLDATRVLAYDGAYNVTQHAYDGAQWFDLADLSGQYILRASGVASLGHGVLHTGVLSSSDIATYARFDGNGWATSAHENGTYVSTGVSDTDDAHMTYFASGVGGNWELRYVAAPDSDPEVVFDYGDPSLGVGTQYVSAVGPIPHTVAARRANGLHEIVHAWRNGPDDWTVATVAAEDDSTAMLCDDEPMFDGELCDFDYIRFRPLGIATSHGGDVRILYSQDHYVGSMSATCEMLGCVWQEVSNESVYTLRIAAPTDTAYDDAALLDRHVSELDLDVDGEGHIHLAAYVYALSGFTVDYLLLGP